MENTCNWIDYTAFGLSIISIFYAILWSTLKIKLDIESIKFNEGEKNSIKINVINPCRCFDAINVKMEICTEKKGKNGKKTTSHFKVEQSDFLMIPHYNNDDDNNRIFKSYFEENARLKMEEKITDTNNVIRVRVYAANSFSSLGKVSKQKFKYNNGIFERI